MLRNLFVSAAMVTGLSGAALAQDGEITLSGGYSQIQLDDFTLDVATLRGGYNFNRYFGVEAEFDVGFDGDSRGACPVDAVCIAAVPAEVELNYGVGLFGVGRLPLTDRFGIFGRAGYNHVDFDTNFTPAGGVGDGSFAWGAGATFDFTENSGVRLDYTRSDFDGLGEADRFGLSYVFRFGG
ncbi:porin family protein [Maricaulis sp.]|uniref:porin family protein n=1 Tax=Maricaulis sp. TaxID=1486257 RepID=UPI002603D128|nr:porin family protein [Maricaulis sp.]